MLEYDEITRLMRKHANQKIATICYAENNGKLLFLLRKKEPFAGYLVPPGGHVEKNEDVESATRREFIEETGLELLDLKLKMVTSERGPEHYNWILFIFVGKTNGTNFVESSEGKLFWIDKDKILQENLSPIDKLLAPYILDGTDIVWKVEIDYDEQKQFKNVLIEKFTDF
ncbi:NUDIX domain-containing protein [Fervidobacterium islandicum]|uniref:NUDIX domain-containing protein n=1 Tax=Fervidobacterium islandicum TaxID=2423 RepID=A0AAI8CMS6_FERIS|nr:NUDIX domain-containing protein [Fervidobacterium islandicum]AMW33276.1 NUDIX domain-containing protein [Fervidobacterium islandicum]